MDTKALRQKILDLAIRGKLVPQDPNDEPASVLLERIRAQKQQMVREGKLKSKDIKDDTVIFVGEDNLHYEKLADGTVKCIEEEIPFDVPKGWLWARIFSIADDLPYGTAKKSEKEGKLVVLRMGNIQSGEIDYNDLVYSSDEEDIARYSLIPGDLLFNRTNSAEWVGKTAIYRGDVPCIYAGYLIRVRTHINAEYLNAVMNSGYAKDYCNSVKTDGVNQSNINAQKLGAFLVPIPPIKEQLRIDAYIAKALPHVQAIGQNKADIAALVSLTKSKILDLAVHGQLVPHNPNDEPASVLLDRIRAEKKELVKQGIIKQDKRESGIFLGEDNSYYLQTGNLIESLSDWGFDDLPDSWAICCLGEICDYGNCINVETDSIDDDAWMLDLEDIEKDTGKVLVRVKKRDRNAASTKHQFHAGQVLYSKLRPYLNKVVLADQGGFCTSEILPLEFECIVVPEYARYYLMSPAFLRYANHCSYGVKMPRLGTADGKKAIVPLPPYKEQERIVKAVHKTFALLDSIAESLS